MMVASCLRVVTLLATLWLAAGQQVDPLASKSHQEILVQPGSQVRLECHLPEIKPVAGRLYYWHFQATGGSTTTVLCFESKCYDDGLGTQLDSKPESGTYDMLINNTSYELNDGLYTCDYKDSQTKQTINREFRLTVLIGPQPPIIVPGTQAPAREGQEYQLNCVSHGGNPEPNITWFRNDQLIGPSPGLRIEQTRVNKSTTSTLSFIPSVEDHQASYKCVVWNKAMSSMQTHVSDYKIQVEYAPRINLGPFNPLKVLQGSQVTLPCQVDANPPVKGIRWFRDGHLISNQFNHTLSEAKVADSSVYTCQADNGIAPVLVAGLQQLQAANANGAQAGASYLPFFASFLSLNSANANNQQAGAEQQSSSISKSPTAVEAQLQLQVLHPPRVQVRPSKSQPLSENDYLALNCSVESSPPPYEYVWTKLDDPTFRRVSAAPNSFLEFQSISASDAGNYTCTAFNRLEPSAFSVSGQPAIEKQAAASALVQVRHKPGLAEIQVGQANGETELGAKTLIQCRARPPGFPEPHYKFWKYQGQGQRLYLNKQAREPVYTIYSAKADDEAKYGCMAVNEMGASSEADGDLIVNEAPTIIHDQSTRRNEDSRPPADYPYSITVRGSGKPEPKVSWFHRSPVDGRRIELSSLELQSKFRIETITKSEQNQMRPKFNVVTTLTFKAPLEVDDRGLYSVEFSNGLSRNAIEEFQLHINHAPIPAPKNQPILSSIASQQAADASSGGAPSAATRITKTKAGFDLGETVNLTCRVSAHPKPDFVWYGNSASDRQIDTNSRYRTSTTNPRDDIWESTLTFSQAQESDYGEYMCVTANQDQQANGMSDSVHIFVHLSRKTTPDAPSQLEAIDATQDSISLQWLPGFDGGFAQNQYLVQYAPDDGSGLSLAKRFPNADPLGVVMAAAASSASNVYQANNALVDNIDQVSATSAGGNQLSAALASAGQSYPKLYDCLSMNPCTINQLVARQAYVFRLRAKNDLGFSEFSEELRASTRANISQIPRILDASFDSSHNILYFKIEPGSDYLLNNLNARIEVRTPSAAAATTTLTGEQQPASADLQEISASQQQQPAAGSSAVGSPSSEWRYHTTVPIRQERAEVRLSTQPDFEQLRITMCSRSNESLCGPEYVVSMKSAASSFLQDQRGLSLSILVSTLALIAVLAGLATTVHSCCLSGKKNKKADSLERIEGGVNGVDNKPNGAASAGDIGGTLSDSSAHKTGSHGSTTSTNSTSANGTSNGLQSMDSIHGGGLTGGSASDHSSDHSRQAKMDSMLPPNYNHYADRASLMIEQQQQLLHQQQGLLSAGDPHKLGSPFGLPNGALLSVTSGQQQQQQQDGLGHFSYGQMDGSQPMSLEHQMLDGGAMMMASSDPTESHNLWSSMIGQQQMVDDYNNYNALGYSTQQQQDQQQQQMIESAYGTTGMMSQQSAAYDNSANSGASQFQAYLGSAYSTTTPAEHQYQQRSQYQQEIAAAQQQMYGTLTRSGYSNANNSSTANNNNNDINKSQQLIDQQYSTAGSNGLVPPAQMTPILNQQPQESDYGTTGGGRSGRLIREIIV